MIEFSLASENYGSNALIQLTLLLDLSTSFSNAITKIKDSSFYYSHCPWIPACWRGLSPLLFRHFRRRRELSPGMAGQLYSRAAEQDGCAEQRLKTQTAVILAALACHTRQRRGSYKNLHTIAISPPRRERCRQATKRNREIMRLVFLLHCHITNHPDYQF